VSSDLGQTTVDLPIELIESETEFVRDGPAIHGGAVVSHPCALSAVPEVWVDGHLAAKPMPRILSKWCKLLNISMLKTFHWVVEGRTGT
jgi:hypothetical protein